MLEFVTKFISRKQYTSLTSLLSGKKQIRVRILEQDPNKKYISGIPRQISQQIFWDLKAQWHNIRTEVEVEQVKMIPLWVVRFKYE